MSFHELRIMVPWGSHGVDEVLRKAGAKVQAGDTKLIWSSDNRDEVENARRTFDELKKKGFSGFSVKRDGERGGRLNEFDPKEEKIIMAPPLRGGE